MSKKNTWNYNQTNLSKEQIDFKKQILVSQLKIKRDKEQEENKLLTRDQLDRLFNVNEQYIQDELNKKNNLASKIAIFIIPLDQKLSKKHVDVYYQFHELFQQYHFGQKNCQIKDIYFPSMDSVQYTPVLDEEKVIIQYFYQSFGFNNYQQEKSSIIVYQYFKSFQNSFICNKSLANCSLFQKYQSTVIQEIGNQFGIINILEDEQLAQGLSNIFQNKPYKLVVDDLKIAYIRVPSKKFKQYFQHTDSFLKIYFSTYYKGPTITFLLLIIKQIQVLYQKNPVEYFYNQ